MVLKIHRGDSPPVAQIVTVSPGNVEIGDTFTLSGDALRLISEMENYTPPDGPLVQRPSPT